MYVPVDEEVGLTSLVALLPSRGVYSALSVSSPSFLSSTDRCGWLMTPGSDNPWDWERWERMRS